MGEVDLSKVEFKQVEELLKKFKSMEAELDGFYEYAAKQIALRLLGYVIPDTPTQENHTITYRYFGQEISKVIRGGTLKRGWIGLDTPGSEPSASDQAAYVQRLPVHRAGPIRSITISNNVEYAPYVEEGHRSRPGRYVPELGAQLLQGWVPGQHMLRRATNNVESMLPGLGEKLVKQYFAGKLK